MTTDQKTAFQLFDKDGDGMITKHEIGHVLRIQGYTPTEGECEQWALECQDPNRITAQEMARIASQADRGKQSKTAQKDLMDALRVFDKENDGMIRENDFRIIMSSLGEAIEQTEVDRVIQVLPVDKNSKIPMQKIVDYLLK
eukprot:g71393.t1